MDGDPARAQTPADVDHPHAASGLQPAQGQSLHRITVDGAVHEGRHRGDRGAQQVLGHVDAVQHVHQHATAGRRGIVSPLRAISGCPGGVDDPEHVHPHRADLAEFPRIDDRLQGNDLGEEHVVVHHGQRHPGFRGGGDHRGRVGRDRRNRLLAQHVLARGGRSEHQIAMQMLRRAHVDHVDVGTGQQGDGSGGPDPRTVRRSSARVPTDRASGPPDRQSGNDRRPPDTPGT